MSRDLTCGAVRGALRAFALGTLREVDRASVQRHVDGCAECAAALAGEVRALSVLDGLPDAEPSRDLAGAIMREVRAQAAPRPRRSRQWVVMQYTAAACTILILAGVLLPALNRARESARRSSSANNLKQMGIVLKMYSNESKGEVLPEISPYDGLWMFDLESVAEEFLTDLNVLVNPRSEEHSVDERALDDLWDEETIDWAAMTQVASNSYTYIGWTVQDEEDVAAVVAAMAGGDGLPRGEREVTRGREPVHRLREGIERFLITDINNPGASALQQSTIPVMFETMDPDNPKPGYNVLYMDGHVEYVLYGEKFPITEGVARMLAAAR